MKRVNILWFSLNSLFLIVFNVMFFMLCDVGNANIFVWISYGFNHFVYGALLLAPFLVRKGSIDFRRPLLGVFLSSMICSVSIIGLPSIKELPLTLAFGSLLFIQIILAAMFLAWLLTKKQRVLQQKTDTMFRRLKYSIINNQ